MSRKLANSQLIGMLADMLIDENLMERRSGPRRFTQEELDACICPKDEMAFYTDCPTHGDPEHRREE